MSDLKKEVQEAPLLWPLTPIPTFEEVYDPKICTEASREISTIFEGWLHPKHEMAKPEALGKIRVLECGHGGLQVSAMFGGGYLGELGANVIMVEPPGGSPLRKLTPFGRKRYMFKDSVNGDLCGGAFLHECRNKQSITLDLTKPAGREILKKLVVHVDVLIENYAPGQFDAWGIGYRQLSKINPRLVYVWNGEKGQWGSLKDKPGEVYPSSACANGWCHATGLPKSFVDSLDLRVPLGRRAGRFHHCRQSYGACRYCRPNLPGQGLRQGPVPGSHRIGRPSQDT